MNNRDLIQSIYSNSQQFKEQNKSYFKLNEKTVVFNKKINEQSGVYGQAMIEIGLQKKQQSNLPEYDEDFRKRAEEYALSKADPETAASFRLGGALNTVGTVASFLPGKPYRGPAVLAASGVYDIATAKKGSGDPALDQAREQRGYDSLKNAAVLGAVPASLQVGSKVLSKVSPNLSQKISEKIGSKVGRHLADTIGGNLGAAAAYAVGGSIPTMLGSQVIGSAAERKAIELGQKFLPTSVQKGIAKTAEYAFPNVYGAKPSAPEVKIPESPVAAPEVKPTEVKPSAGRPRPSPGRGRFRGGFAAIPAITDPVGHLADVGVGKLLGGSSILGAAALAPLFINQSAGGGEEQWLATQPSNEEQMKQAEEFAKQKEKEQEEKKKEMSRTGMRPLPGVKPIEPERSILHTNIGLKEQVKQLVNEATKLPRTRSGGPRTGGGRAEVPVELSALERARQGVETRRALAKIGIQRQRVRGEEPSARVPSSVPRDIDVNYAIDLITKGRSIEVPPELMDHIARTRPDVTLPPAPEARTAPPRIPSRPEVEPVPVKPPEAEPVVVPTKPAEVTPELPTKIAVPPQPTKITDTGITPQPIAPERVTSKTTVDVETPQPQPQPQPSRARPKVAIATGVKQRDEEPDSREDQILKLINARLAKPQYGTFSVGSPSHYYTSRTLYSQPLTTEQEEELERRRYYRASLMQRVTESVSAKDIDDIAKELIAREKSRLPDVTDVEIKPRESETFKVDEPLKPESSKTMNLDMYLNKIRELRSRFSPHHFWQMPTDTAIAMGYAAETKGRMPYGYRQY